MLFEIADDGPGFTVDGPVEELGTRIILPPFLEDRREIEARLTPLPDLRAGWPEGRSGSRNLWTWPPPPNRSPTSCRAAKRASRALAQLDTGTKDRALHAIADAIDARADEILEANARDMEAASDELSAAFKDKMRLDAARVAAMAEGVRAIVALQDPVGEVIEGFRLPNGLDVRKVRVPLGVVAVVYEARPNVTIDCTALAVKSGNAIVLRGSSQVAHSNAVLAAIATEAASGAGLPRRARSDWWRAGGARRWPSWPPRRGWST